MNGKTEAIDQNEKNSVMRINLTHNLKDLREVIPMGGLDRDNKILFSLI